jgi:3-hydroxybutyryl-CoA dehydrogenase
MGGLDVWLAGEDNMLPALDNSTKACDAMRNLVKAGNLGIKSGKGFFDYPPEKRAGAQTAFYKRLIVQLKASKNY